MCTLIALLGTVDGYPLVVAMNRDEFYERPSVSPELRRGKPAIVAPRDERAEGTWIGVNEFGLVAAVSNRFYGQPDPRARSRGLLCLESLAHPDTRSAQAFASGEAEVHAYNPFNLFHADLRTVACTSRQGGATSVHAGVRGVNVLTNEGLNADDPRGLRVLALLAGAPLNTLAAATTALERALSDHADAGGRAICHHGEKTGTRSRTIIAVSETGWSRNRLTYAEGFPCTAHPREYHDRFR
jgi:uncharacterized protein with NRDE domain